jgi:hypothetical protein
MKVLQSDPLTTSEIDLIIRELAEDILRVSELIKKLYGEDSPMEVTVNATGVSVYTDLGGCCCSSDLIGATDLLQGEFRDFVS